MAWLEDNESQAVIDSRNNRLIPPWPADNTPRINPRFRFLFGPLLPAPRAQRWLVRIQPTLSPTDDVYNGWLDLSAVADNVLEGATGPNPDGWDVKLTVTEWRLMPSPNFNDYGIERRLTISQPGFPDFWVSSMSLHDPPPAAGIPIGLTVFQDLGNFPLVRQTNYDPLVNTNWTNQLPSVYAGIGFWNMSECWQFPEPEGGAEFNGVDARILFDQFLPQNPGAFRLTADAAWFGGTRGQFISGTDFRELVSWDSNFITWSGGTLDVTNDWKDGSFHTFRIERGWTGAAGNSQVWIDEVLKATQSTGFRASDYDRINSRGNTIDDGVWTMKNLKLWYGTELSNTLMLDMPLQANACDISPSGIKGTTENMSLPSCP